MFPLKFKAHILTLLNQAGDRKNPVVTTHGSSLDLGDDL